MRKRWFSIPFSAWITLTLLVLLIVGLWVFRTSLAESYFRTQLSSIGLADSDFQLTSVNPRRVEIQNLQSVNGAQLKRGEIAIDWSAPTAPTIATVTLTGLELQLGGSTKDSNWLELLTAAKGNTANEDNNGTEGRIDIPELKISNASVRVLADDDSLLAEVRVPIVSLIPDHDPDGHTVKGDTHQTFDIKAEIRMQSLRTHGLGAKDTALSIAGRIEHNNGQLYYRPNDCDRVSLDSLKKENFSLTGPFNACISAGDKGASLVIDRDGKITLDVELEPESARIDVNVSALPPIPVEIENGSLSIRFSHGPTGGQVERIASRELDLVLPGAAIALEAVEISAKTQRAEVESRGLLLDFGVQKIRHLATPQMLLPLVIDGQAKWSSETLAVDATYRQSPRALNGTLQLQRDNETGEGQASFDIAPLNFGESGLVASDVSPAIARYIEKLAGELQASGKILFNDAWATPLQVAGTGKNLKIEMKANSPAATESALAVNLGESKLNLSLPPLSPEKGWATLNVADGGLQLGDAELSNLTGTVNIKSLWPPRCPTEPDANASETKNNNGPEATIVNCLHESFAKGESETFRAAFDDTMAQLTNYVTRMRLSQSPE